MMSYSFNSKYIRDKRSPTPLNENVSKVMSATQRKNTKSELLLRKALRGIGLIGYRLHWKKVPGSPDIAFPGKKIAIFVNGCYWHRCPHCNYKLPEHNKEFWREKFITNVKRDVKNIKDLEEMDWNTLVIWECQINNNINDCISKINKLIAKRDKVIK